MPAVRIETESTTTMLFTDAEICEALRKAGHKIPMEGAQVTFRVPGGGDWSNVNVEVNVDNPLTIAWVTKSTGYGL